jgi:hypothetical protein
MSVALAAVMSHRRRLPGVGAVLALALMVPGCSDDEEAGTGTGAGGGGGGAAATSSSSSSGSSTSSGGELTCSVWTHEEVAPRTFLGGQRSLAQTSDGTVWAAWIPEPEDVLDKEMWVAFRQGSSWIGGPVLETAGFDEGITAVGADLHAVAISEDEVLHARSVAHGPWEQTGRLTEGGDGRSNAYLFVGRDGRMQLAMAATDIDDQSALSIVDLTGDEPGAEDRYPVPGEWCRLARPIPTADGDVVLSGSCDDDEGEALDFALRHGPAGWSAIDVPTPMARVAASPDGTRVLAVSHAHDGEDCDTLTLWSLDAGGFTVAGEVDVACGRGVLSLDMAIDDTGRTVLAMITGVDDPDSYASQLAILEHVDGAFGPPVVIGDAADSAYVNEMILDRTTACPILAWSEYVNAPGTSTSTKLRVSSSTPGG